MKKATEYHMFRYFIVNNTQQNFIDNSDVVHFRDEFLNMLVNEEKIKYRYRNKDYIFYPLHNFDNKLFICKYSKESRITRHLEGDTDIDVDKEVDYPFVYVVISTENQVILIQRNRSVFPETLTTKNRLNEMFNRLIGSYKYEIMIESITDKEQFWMTVESAKKVFNLKLKLNAPNLFGARVKANQFMREQRKAYNITDLELKLNNSEGELKLSKDNLDDFVEYAAEGGGLYHLSYSDGVDVKSLDSKNQSKRIKLPDELTEADYSVIMTEIRKIDRLSGNGE